MSKYIIDIPDGVEWGVVTCRTEDGFYTRDFDSLEDLNSDYINEHYGDLQDTAYQRGLEDAWNVARKIAVETDDGGVSISALYEMFGTESMCMIMKNNTVYDAIAKLKAYEKNQADNKIGVGDVVIYKGKKWIVTSPETNERYASLMDSNGIHCSASFQNCQKTGEHYNINEILGGLSDD